ncbi:MULTISPECIES: autotransporter domain-containing protein [unclassified Pseudomonas]|uniref:autotransporter domain-containing protein n=1 Tax=unclassified Pseudomonas TaxID=196821 RepID=UPI000839525D|nr:MULTISPECIES: autotransporter domain-containing protein [unclassified Pseudomonas]QIH07518.1 autotransporter domain-containing protein [Pseudomonas sp. BIOMIG1BAC]
MKTPLIALGTWVKRPLLSLFMLLVMLSLANQAMAAAPVITSPASGSTLPSVAVGQSMSIPISSTGGALPLDRWVECDANDPDYDGVTPCLPSGLILDPSPGSATTTLHGAPTTAGSYTFSITLNDGLNQGGVATYTLLVTSGATPTLTSVSPNTGTTAGATAVTLSGTNLTGATAVSFGGTAATGFSVSNASTITATTPAHAAGAVNVMVTTPSGTATLTNAYTYAVPAPTVGPVSATVAANSSSNPITLSLSGGAATSVAVSTAATHGTATATGTSITYTPAPGYSGSDTFTYTATNASGTSSPATVSLTVSAPTLAITPTTVPNGTQGTAYSTTLTASGGTAPYTYAITSGSLPAGLSLNTSNGSISGTPSASGNTNLTVTATDANSATGSRAYTLTIDAQAPVSNAVSATVVANSSSNPITLNITGGTATSVAVATAAAHGTATATGTGITYTPAPGYSGNDTFAYTATNTSGTSSPATVTLTVSAPTLSINPASLGAGTSGTAYSAVLSSSGGSAPYTYSITSGSLPAGLSLNASTGTISGTPTASGTSNLTLTSTDSNGATGSRAYSISISAVPISVPASSQILSAGEEAIVDLTQGATGGPFTQVILGTVSPASAGRAMMRGPFSMRFVPSAAFAGTAIISFRLHNGTGSSAASTVSFIVQPRPDPTKDGEVIGLLNAQSRSAERFASTQMDNFNHRLEQLHQMRCDRNSFNASLRKDGSDLPLGEMAKAIEQQLGSSANQTEQQKREAASAAQNGECQQQALAFWSDGFVNNGSTHARGARDNSFTTMGLSAGADYRLSPTVIAGIGIGYGTDRSEIGDHKTRSDADAIGIATYLSLNPASQFYLDGLLGYNRISFDSRRYITGSANDYARGSRDADQLFASLTASYEYRQGQLSLTPYGRFNASTTRLDAFSENGGGIYGLSYEEQRQQNFTSYLGLRTGYDLMTRVGVVTPKVGLAWGHNFSTHSDYKMRYTDQGDEGILYRLKPDAQDSDFASLDMGMDFNLGRAWQLGFSYKTALGSDERNDSFRLGLNGKF